LPTLPAVVSHCKPRCVSWPLVAGGVRKIVYDLLLFGLFRRVRRPSESPLAHG